MNDNLLTGKLVRLVVDKPETLAAHVTRWYADSEYSRLLDWDPANRRSVRSNQKWTEKHCDDETMYSFSIRSLADDQLIGIVGLDGIRWSHGDCFVGIGLGDRLYWGKGYGTDAMQIILRFAFTELNLHRVSLDVFEYNQRAIRSYQKAGFVIEGRQRSQVQRDGRRWDDVFMGILKEDWLKLEPGNNGT